MAAPPLRPRRRRQESCRRSRLRCSRRFLSKPVPSALASARRPRLRWGWRRSRREPLDGDLILRRRRSLIGRHQPKTLSHVLMHRILAWREQVAEVGDISSRSRAILAAALAPKVGEGKDSQAPNSEGAGNHDAHRHRPHAPIRIGTTLIREHAGVLHRVTVVAEGFEWDGQIFASLSAVARAITGVRWNGRRFFALDRGPRRQAVAPKGREQDAGARRAADEPIESARD